MHKDGANSEACKERRRGVVSKETLRIKECVAIMEIMGDGAPRSSRMLWLYACIVLILSIHAHRTSADSTCRTNLATAANITIFPTDALQCMNTKFSPDNSGNNFLVWSLKDVTTGFVSIVVSAPLGAQQWAGIGFSGPGQMIGSTAIVATLGGKGVINVDEYFLKDKVPSKVIKDSTRIAFTAGPESFYNDQYNTVYMAFQIDFNSSKAIPNYLLFAQGPTSSNSNLQTHTAQTYLPSSFATGTVGESAATKLAKKVKAHGAVNIFGWGVLLPIGAMVARYAKSFNRAWFYIHITFQVSGFIFIIAGVALGVDIAKSVDVGPHLSGHKGLGFFLFTLAILQVLAVVARPRKDAKVRKYWNWYHWWVGRLALFLAVINIFLGIGLNMDAHKLKAGYIVLLVLELVAFAILETLYWLRWNRTVEPFELPTGGTGTSIGWNRTSEDAY